MAPEQASARPTPYPEVNAILDLLLRQVRAILGEDLVGIYLFGSLSWGDFDPGSSDIDFLVATAGELPEGTLAALEAMHAGIAAGGLPWATKLEGAYIQRDALRRYDPANARHPTIGVDWPFGPGQHGSDWIIQRHILRERGVALWGPPPRALIAPVRPDELRAAASEATLGWTRHLDGPDWLRPRNYQAFAILTMCRALYLLERGEVASKPVAAAWARRALEPPWPPLVERALRWRYDTQPDDLTATLDFIRYTIGRCRQLATDQ